MAFIAMVSPIGCLVEIASCKSGFSQDHTDPVLSRRLPGGAPFTQHMLKADLLKAQPKHLYLFCDR